LSRPWTTRELAQLRAERTLGAAALAERLERSLWSVKSQAKRERISLRRCGEGRGLALGQPRAVRLSLGVHAAAVADPDMAGQRALLYREAALCPDCGRRRVTVPETGLCELCHVEFLEQSFSTARPALRQAEALFVAIAEHFGSQMDTQRLLAQARKRRQRARGRT
jgi:hypothetical protein